ncbi:hypothetical protein IQ06DRAFT_291585 [Phaeosphaeriaceae sp. SRC1lsM3a]|nr:hypothetical protein IQ06DRAFT_291585 [Stagonospora sp. SRC1lsM3a]
MHYPALFAFLCCVLCTHAQIVSTSFAESRFIGWYVGATTEPMLAANTWVTSGGFAGDCSGNGKCAMPTTCSSGIVYYDNSQTLKCTGVFSCVAMTIYASQPNVLPSARNYGCRAQWSANTLYKELATTATPSSSSAPVSSASPASSAAPTTLAMSTTPPAITSNPSSTPSSASTGTPLGQDSSSGSSSSSKAWIAGAVVGPLVLLGALVAGLLFWRRRRNQKRDASQMPLTQEIGSSNQPYGQNHHAEKYAYNGPAEEMPTTQMQYAELPVQHAPSELPATRY